MGLISLVDLLFDLLSWLIIGRCILSFVQHDPYHPVIQWVYRITDPVLKPFRQLIPATSGIDFSPLVALLVIMVVNSLVVRILLIII
ncbi:MAG: YggT family protein [Bacillota bacterium]|jgi:YggT family protein